MIKYKNTKAVLDDLTVTKHDIKGESIVTYGLPISPLEDMTDEFEVCRLLISTVKEIIKRERDRVASLSSSVLHYTLTYVDHIDSLIDEVDTKHISGSSVDSLMYELNVLRHDLNDTSCHLVTIFIKFVDDNSYAYRGVMISDFTAAFDYTYCMNLDSMTAYDLMSL